MLDPSSQRARFLVIGDLHGHWGDVDRSYLEETELDHAMFVGDLGDEDVEIVAEITRIDVPKAVILGNHDAWQSFSERRPTPRLLESLDLLGADHVAYTRRELPAAGLTMIGARPFTWGGADLRSPEVYGELYGVRTPRMSAQKIVDLAVRAEHQDILILAHNGPTGLGDRTDDIFGKDFGRRPGGDWGDRDLELAIERIQKQGRRVRAVIAGHMHDRLTTPPGGRRTRFVRRDGIDYLNAAVVPRVRRLPDGTEVRHFLRTDWREGRMIDASEIWVDANGDARRTEAVQFTDLPDSDLQSRSHGT